MSGYVLVDRGGLLVPERAADAMQVRGELRRLDRDLMLTRDWDPDYRTVVWQVRHNLGSGVEPVVVFEWREQGGTGRPLPLSSGFVEAFKAQEARGRDLARAVKRRNEKRREDERRRFDADLEEYAKEMGRAGSELHGACFHRGIHLRRARARREARGG